MPGKIFVLKAGLYSHYENNIGTVLAWFGAIPLSRQNNEILNPSMKNSEAPTQTISEQDNDHKAKCETDDNIQILYLLSY